MIRLRWKSGVSFGALAIMISVPVNAEASAVTENSAQQPVHSADANDGSRSQPVPPEIKKAAQTDVADPSAIIVTARKRNERAIDVPIALTTFQGQALEQRGARNVADVLQEAQASVSTTLAEALRKSPFEGSPRPSAQTRMAIISTICPSPA
jgi:hypothetical protein